jgi:hypothetical protein
MNVPLGQPLFLGELHAFGNPSLELFDGIAANGELDQM